MTLRVAIVGAGPAGIYAADLLLKEDGIPDVSIDLFERLPAPYGLVRYGVAPDHPRIKGIVNSLREILDSGHIRLFGNVNFGADITLEDLKRHYHAVIFATGARNDASLDIPGIELPGSYGAADFVSWYDGHPDVPLDWSLEAKEVAIIGNGNVALDVARMLVKRPKDLYPTEIPDNVYRALESSQVTDVHVYGRRGPRHVKFTPLELRELGELGDVDIILDDRDFIDREGAERLGAQGKQGAVIERIFDEWRNRDVGSASRRLHFHFFAKPLEIFGTTAVEGLSYERTWIDFEGRVSGTGEIANLHVQAVYRAVGYHGSPIPGLPFDEDRGVIPNHAGMVLSDARVPTPGVFVTGWIKRGPIGLIGHTKSDAMETVSSLRDAMRSFWSPTQADPGCIVDLLRSRGVKFTSLSGWHKLDEREIKLGTAKKKERLKVVSRGEMLEVMESGR